MLLTFITIFLISTVATKDIATKATAITPVTPVNPCITIKCVDYGPPICAIRDGIYRIFSSPCALLMHNCFTDDDHDYVEMDYCAKYICPIKCPPPTSSSLKELVCATNGVDYLVFHSKCEFFNFACLKGRDYDRIPFERCVEAGVYP